MTVINDLWPDNQAPGKEQIERMYKCAYYLDRSFFKPSDIPDYGIDLVRLKEFGEVVMRKPLPQLRARTKALWDRMSRVQRTMFYYSYISQGIKYLSWLLDNTEAMIGNCMSERHALTNIQSTLPRKFPEELQEKIREGFGRDWIQ